VRQGGRLGAGKFRGWPAVIRIKERCRLAGIPFLELHGGMAVGLSMCRSWTALAQFAAAVKLHSRAPM
jgi:hypothetical protein